MRPKPVLFISAVSRELHSARDLVAKTVTLLGYDADWQDIFGTEQGDIKEMLRRRIDAADGVIQLIGQCHGFEPPQPDPEFRRVSYTQYEALYARQRGKRVWYILLDDTFPADPHYPEPDDQRQLQSAYRQRILSDTHLYHRAANHTELENRIHGLKNELAVLRRRFAQWAALVLGLLLVIVAGGVWLENGQGKQGATVEKIKSQNEKLLAAVRELSTTLTQTSQTGAKEDEQTRLARAYSALEDKLKLPRGTLAEELPKFAEQLLQRSDTSLMDRASLLFVMKKFAEAEAAALEAKDKALATGRPGEDLITALELAGSAAEAQIHYSRALEHYRAAAELTSEQRDPVAWAGVQSEVAMVLYLDAQYHDAEVICRKVHAVLERVLGSERPDTLNSRNSLAAALYAQGKYAEAEVEFRAALASCQRVLGPKHRQTLFSRNNLASALCAQGKYAEAEAEYRAVLGIQQQALGSEDPHTLTSRTGLAIALDAQGKHAEAELRAVLGIMVRVMAERPDVFRAFCNLALCLEAQGRKLEALVFARRGLAGFQKTLGEAHLDTKNAKELVEDLQRK